MFLFLRGSSVWESVLLGKNFDIQSLTKMAWPTNLEKRLVKQFRKKLTYKNITHFLISEINSKIKTLTKNNF